MPPACDSFPSNWVFDDFHTVGPHRPRPLAVARARPLPLVLPLDAPLPVGAVPRVEPPLPILDAGAGVENFEVTLDEGGFSTNESVVLHDSARGLDGFGFSVLTGT